MLYTRTRHSRLAIYASNRPFPVGTPYKTAQCRALLHRVKQVGTKSAYVERMEQNKYTLDDAGCYVDGARGIYMVDKIVAIANTHGANIKHDCDDNDCGYDGQKLSSCQWSGDYEDQADEYMNDHCPVQGAWWGRSEQGDWGLWADEETD